MKSIKITYPQWDKIFMQLLDEYPKSKCLTHRGMREILGFTVRRDTRVVYLDFYSEPKRTLFLLKYSEYIEQ